MTGEVRKLRKWRTCSIGASSSKTEPAGRPRAWRATMPAPWLPPVHASTSLRVSSSLKSWRRRLRTVPRSCSNASALLGCATLITVAMTASHRLMFCFAEMLPAEPQLACGNCGWLAERLGVAHDEARVGPCERLQPPNSEGPNVLSRFHGQFQTHLQGGHSSYRPQARSRRLRRSVLRTPGNPRLACPFSVCSSHKNHVQS